MSRSNNSDISLWEKAMMIWSKFEHGSTSWLNKNNLWGKSGNCMNLLWCKSITEIWAYFQDVSADHHPRHPWRFKQSSPIATISDIAYLWIHRFYSQRMWGEEERTLAYPLSWAMTGVLVYQQCNTWRDLGMACYFLSNITAVYISLLLFSK